MSRPAVASVNQLKIPKNKLGRKQELNSRGIKLDVYLDGKSIICFRLESRFPPTLPKKYINIHKSLLHEKIY